MPPPAETQKHSQVDGFPDRFGLVARFLEKNLTEARDCSDIYGFPIEPQNRKAYYLWLGTYAETIGAQKSAWMPLFSTPTTLRPTVAKVDINAAAVRRGVDSKHRKALWRLFCGAEDSIHAQPKLFERLLIDTATTSSPHLEQIEKDVPRTFPHISDSGFSEVRASICCFRVVTRLSGNPKSLVGVLVEGAHYRLRASHELHLWSSVDVHG